MNIGFKWLQQWLDERLPQCTDRKIVPGAPHGDTYVLQFPAPDPSTRWITTLCHYDTVWPKGTLASWPISITGDKLSGPGAFDMKAGLVQLVWAIKACDELGLPRPNIRLILNGDEEIGSPSSRPVIEHEVRGSEAVLVFEASANGALKTARKGVGIFRVHIEGVEAHAGLDPTAGISAVDELARVVRHLHEAADLERGTSVNVGIIRGGTRTNVTAGNAVAEIDVRISSQDEQVRIDQVFASLTPYNPSARITVDSEWNRPVMERTSATADLYGIAQEAAHSLGSELTEVSAGGASDGNFAAAVGIPVLDGLGAVGGGAHARDEWVSLDGMSERTALTAQLLTRIAGHPAVTTLK
ncbi:M20 family metallopeptidase [Rhodococcus sp. KBW08]|uniref:M20 family metallopeptidase n=1 Tax=Rhodococcus sp. KBW08 TaxID=2144188 RepID=UPI001C8ACC5B|nr:M20 family metallopeptidase [Rhodococcus sp. KBW08]